jgi:hypothetical protein
MVHISKSRKTGKYHVGTKGVSRLLSSAEANGFNTKKGTHKNIAAQMRIFNSPGIYVQDNTMREIVVFRMRLYGPNLSKFELIKAPNVKPKKAYVPGK